MRYILTAVFLLIATAAHANDGGISFGGTPRLLIAHPSVSMESEVVNMTVGDKIVTVDCTFVFRNRGPACTARMGFPDQGEGANDPDEEHADDFTKRPVTSLFRSFHSWIDGRPIATKLIRSDESGLFWHAKTVAFGANGRHVVRDLYTVDVGFGAAGAMPDNSAVFASETYYTLHTGASWHSPIGRSVINVRFARSDIPTPMVVEPMVPDQRADPSPYLVRYKAPCAPQVEGKTLRFVRTHWRPQESDDIYLVFAPKRQGAQ